MRRDLSPISFEVFLPAARAESMALWRAGAPSSCSKKLAGSASKKVPVLRILLAIIPALMSAWPKTRTAPHWMAYLARNPRHFSPTAVQCRPTTRTGLQASTKPGQ